MDLLALRNSPETIAAKTSAIREALPRDSRYITQPNFEGIDTDDLSRLFDLYDREFFGGWIAQAVQAKTTVPLRFRLSPTMTRAGGKTIKYRRRNPDGSLGYYYEIAVASRMLFMTFVDIARPVLVGGLVCRDRLDSLQRIMEHEIIHLAELLTWDNSSCSKQRFRALAMRIFGHTDTTHALVTPYEYAVVEHGVRVGGMVEFDFEGRRFTGKVNRVHRRATVLVADERGTQYTDGKKYAKFYIPLNMLKPCPAQG